jgi:hypothetical protein
MNRHDEPVRNQAPVALRDLLDGDITRKHLPGTGVDGIDAFGGKPGTTVTGTITRTLSLLFSFCSCNCGTRGTPQCDSRGSFCLCTYEPKCSFAGDCR